jgi:protein SCO1/2
MALSEMSERLETNEPTAGRAPLQPMLQNRLGWALFALFILAIPTWALMNEERLQGDAPPIFTTPASVPLIDQDGADVQLDDYKGSIVIVNFLFTRCPDICPALATRFLDLASRVPERIDGVPIRFLSITVDPEFDRPEVLHTYRNQFGSDLDRWQLWTGEKDSIDATVAEFQQVLDRLEEGEAPLIVHSDRFIVLDPEGRIRNFYPSEDVGLSALETDLSIIAAGF